MHQDDASDEASRTLGIEAEVEVDDLGLRQMLEVEVRNRPKGLIAPDRELELDKQNDQALDSSIDFSLSLYIDLALLFTDDFYLPDFTLDNDLLVDLT